MTTAAAADCRSQLSGRDRTAVVMVVAGVTTVERRRGSPLRKTIAAVARPADGARQKRATRRDHAERTTPPGEVAVSQRNPADDATVNRQRCPDQ
ncbi:hypothetical protein [Dactylosporangium sp. NPDC050588]|uniref:hypothetical protein n=1 Tax=Dactylosporangium sp. NPDC050588 TaxID=3157211 RepID=UPI003410D2A8